MQAAVEIHVSSVKTLADKLKQNAAKKMLPVEKLATESHKYTSMSHRVNILKFLKCLNEKNYAAAHKYLKSIMEQKIANRIAKCKNTKVF